MAIFLTFKWQFFWGSGPWLSQCRVMLAFCQVWFETMGTKWAFVNKQINQIITNCLTSLTTEWTPLTEVNIVNSVINITHKPINDIHNIVDVFYWTENYIVYITLGNSLIKISYNKMKNSYNKMKIFYNKIMFWLHLYPFWPPWP